jgi:hypothetical protein
MNIFITGYRMPPIPKIFKSPDSGPPLLVQFSMESALSGDQSDFHISGGRKRQEKAGREGERGTHPREEGRHRTLSFQRGRKRRQ